MSLTSYRAAPPRVKIIRKREARAPPAAGYVATASPGEKGAAPLSSPPPGAPLFVEKPNALRRRGSLPHGRTAVGALLSADGLHEPADELALGRYNPPPGVGGR